ncbi:hypothetical protein [Ornithinimicrobium kibberense]|uniref:hypothetical protein n=1 Tax=Ornithinimicrobium kibberense TaxID=282060 RepID=UPI00361313D9
MRAEHGVPLPARDRSDGGRPGPDRTGDPRLRASQERQPQAGGRRVRDLGRLGEPVRPGLRRSPPARGPAVPHAARLGLAGQPSGRAEPVEPERLLRLTGPAPAPPEGAARWQIATPRRACAPGASPCPGVAPTVVLWFISHVMNH